MKADPLPLYAANLDIRDVPVLVVGGGAVAAVKTARLLKSGAKVTVVAPQFTWNKAPRGRALKLLRRRFRETDLDGPRLVFAATDDLELNQRIATGARQRGLLVNVAAPPAAGNLYVCATLQRGPLSVAFSTGGASCAVSKTLREHIEARIGPEWGDLAKLLGQRRPTILRLIADPATRRRVLQTLGSARWAKYVTRLGRRGAARKMDACIASEAKRQPKSGGATT